MGTKISSLPAAGAVTGSELVLLVQGGVTSRATSSTDSAIVQTAAELAASLTPTNYGYAPGNVLRYGIVPNSLSSATANTTIFRALCNPLVDGPTNIVFPNTTGIDIYYFNGFVQIGEGLHIDLQNCRLSCTAVTQYADDNNGFLFLMRNVTIENGSIYLDYVSGGTATNSVAAIMMGGRDAPVAGSPLPTIFDSLLKDKYGNYAQMGNLILRNLEINVNTNIAFGTTGVYGILGLGGVNNVLMENIHIEGNSVAADGLYYEFGWATSGSVNQRQTSHAHNWTIRNLKVTNLITTQSGYGVAFQSNGGYNISIDGLHASNCGSIVSFGTGEAMFLTPWIGVDDFGTLAQNGVSPLPGTSAAARVISLRNIVGRQISYTGMYFGGVNAPNSYQNAGILPWVPGYAYATSAVVYNGANKYTCASGGTSTTYAVDNTCTGPTGVGSGISDGTCTWNYTATAGGTGFHGYEHSFAYVVNDIVLNGQYAYVCTTAGTSGTHQGPVGVGTGISDTDGSLCKWSSIPTSTTAAAPLNSAWNLCVGLLNFTLDGFVIDSGTTGTLSGGYGITNAAGICVIRNGAITNMNRGIVTHGDAERMDVDGVAILDCGGLFGMQIGGPSTSFFLPSRGICASLRNSQIAGISNAGSTIGYGISIATCSSFLIESNRFGYSVENDGIAETTMEYAVFGNVVSTAVSYQGITCLNNICNLAAGGYAYYIYPTTGTNYCVINNPLGASQSVHGNWAVMVPSTGWGTPTGAVLVTNFPGATATLVQCSNTIAELITVLQSQGLLAT